MTTTEKPVGPVVGPRYYRSFASYEIPFRPVEPVRFEDTEGMRSYYAAYCDPNGRLVRFDKRQFVRVAKEGKELAPSVPARPGARLYFEAIRDRDAEQPHAGHQLEYEATEHREEFFAGTVDGSGQNCRAFLFRRETSFTDAYEYWSNGRLRKRTMTGPDRVRTVAEYDEDGHLISRRETREPLHEANKAKSLAGDHSPP